jgi:hypothetical protein
MSQELANQSNTINLTMASKPSVAVPAASSYDSGILTASPTLSKRVGPLSGSKIICYDTETTGTVPTDSRLLVVSFWDLSKPISEMVTFADFDEEKLTWAIADYLNEEKPDALVQYNNGFDERFLLTRFMLYGAAVPGWNDIQQIDVMQILQRGTTQNISSSQAVGTEESWLDYFYGEVKPFTIEECFEGVRNGSLTEFIIRNRSCVESEGSIYLLFRSVTDVEPLDAYETPVTTANVEEAAAQGLGIIKCPTCGADNDLKIGSTGNTCWRCMGSLPDPDSTNILKEVLREFDFTKVGLSAK